MARFPLDTAKKQLTITGYNTVRELNGGRSIEGIEIENRQNISSSRSFAHGVTEMAELETALAEYAQIAVSRMRAEGSACRLVSVFLMTARVYEAADKGKEYFNSASAKLPHATSYLPDILRTAVVPLRSIYRRGYEYRKIMVNLLALEKDADMQGDLFEAKGEAERERNRAVMAACDKINGKYGAGFLHTGVRLQTREVKKDGKAADWIMKREFLSPEYTSKWADLPEVF